jgi:tetratricopeptide (TPR) repeat protein
VVQTIERIAVAAWSSRFRIAPWVFVTAAAFGIAGLAAFDPTGRAELILAAAVLIGLGGLGHWVLERRRCRFAVVVPRFHEDASAKGRAADAQQLIVDDLRRHLPTTMSRVIQPVSVTVGPADDELAEKLHRRLGAAFVLHGRVTTAADSWSVYPRILERVQAGAMHRDPHTRDVTPANPRFGPFVSSLPPTVGVRDEEFPLSFCRDIEATVRGMAGLFLTNVGAHEEALEELDAALAVAGTAPNRLLDELRTAKARSLAKLDRRGEGITLLRGRVHTAPSPSLLRWLAHLVAQPDPATGEIPERDRREAIELLRRALEDEHDPQRDMTVYNLLSAVGPLDDEGNEQEEFNRLLDHLLRSPSRYRRQWYVKHAVAARAWFRHRRALEDGDKQSARRHAKEAARWYGRTIRARPRLQFLGFRRRFPFAHLRPFHRSPILYANAVDADREAGFRLRRRWNERRFQSSRLKLMKKGEPYVAQGEWDHAFAYYDWTIVGRQLTWDQREFFTATWAACLLWKGGSTLEGERRWTELHIKSPNALLARGRFVQQLREHGLNESVPGDEPVQPEEVADYVADHWDMWSDDAKQAFLRDVEYMSQIMQADEVST